MASGLSKLSQLWFIKPSNEDALFWIWVQIIRLQKAKHIVNNNKLICHSKLVHANHGHNFYAHMTQFVFNVFIFLWNYIIWYTLTK